MAENDVRLESLEDEVKVLKGEVKRTLVDLRALLMREDSPLGENGAARRAARAEPAPAPVLEPAAPKEVAPVVSSTVNDVAPPVVPQPVASEPVMAVPGPGPGAPPGAPPAAVPGPGPGAPPQAWPGSGTGIFPGAEPQSKPGPGPGAPLQGSPFGGSPGGASDAEAERWLVDQERRVVETEAKANQSLDGGLNGHGGIDGKEMMVSLAAVKGRIDELPQIGGSNGDYSGSDPQDDAGGGGNDWNGPRPVGGTRRLDEFPNEFPMDNPENDEAPRGQRDQVEAEADEDSGLISLGKKDPGGAGKGSDKASVQHDRQDKADAESTTVGEPAPASVFDEYQELMRANTPDPLPEVEMGAAGPPLDVNLISSLTYWVSLAKQRIGEDQLKGLLELYVLSGHSKPELQNLLLHLADMVRVEPMDPAPHAEEWVDLMFHLHGILTGSYPVVKMPVMNLPTLGVAQVEDES